MNIFEFCERFHISHAKAKKMNKAGVLRLDDNTREKSRKSVTRYPEASH
jgi:hypothetical protein